MADSAGAYAPTSRVSVCVPTYNPGAFLPVALASILDQTYRDFELLVVDDASEPPVDRVLVAFRDVRIRRHRNERNLGLPGNWNECIRLARGELIAIFHQDDVMRPDFLAQAVAALDRHPGVGLVYSNIDRIDHDGRFIARHYVDQPASDRSITGPELYAMVAATGNPIACPAVVTRTACYAALGHFDAALPFATDQEMWMRIARSYDVAYLAAPLVSHRMHPDQETARFAGTGRDYLDMLRALQRAFPADLPAAYARHEQSAFSTLARQARAMARFKLRSGHVASAMRYGAVHLAATRRACRPQCVNRAR